MVQSKYITHLFILFSLLFGLIKNYYFYLVCCRRSNSTCKSPVSSPKDPPVLTRDIGRSESLRSPSSWSHRIFRPCDLIHGEILGKGFFGQAIKVCICLTTYLIFLVMQCNAFIVSTKLSRRAVSLHWIRVVHCWRTGLYFLLYQNHKEFRFWFHSSKLRFLNHWISKQLSWRNFYCLGMPQCRIIVPFTTCRRMQKFENS